MRRTYDELLRFLGIEEEGSPRAEESDPIAPPSLDFDELERRELELHLMRGRYAMLRV